jgi:hypothetical protein
MYHKSLCIHPLHITENDPTQTHRGCPFVSECTKGHLLPSLEADAKGSSCSRRSNCSPELGRECVGPDKQGIARASSSSPRQWHKDQSTPKSCPPSSSPLHRTLLWRCRMPLSLPFPVPSFRVVACRRPLFRSSVPSCSHRHRGTSSSPPLTLAPSTSYHA